MRNVVADGAAEDFDRGLEQDDGGGAVDVVVAVDEDGLAPPQWPAGCARPPRPCHAAHRGRADGRARDEGTRLRMRHPRRRAGAAGKRRVAGTPAALARASTADRSRDGSTQCAKAGDWTGGRMAALAAVLTRGASLFVCVVVDDDVAHALDAIRAVAGSGRTTRSSFRAET